MYTKIKERKEILHVVHKDGLQKQVHNNLLGNITKKSKTDDFFITTSSTEDLYSRTLKEVDMQLLIKLLERSSIKIAEKRYIHNTLSFSLIKELNCEYFYNNISVLEQETIITTLDYELLINNKVAEIKIKRSLKVFCNASIEHIANNFEEDLREVIDIYGSKLHKLDSSEINQSMDLILARGTGGVLVHEAVGHCLEADNVYENSSIFSNKINKKVGNGNLNISDVPFKNISISSDGTRVKAVNLIKDGFVKNVISDKYTSKAYGIEDTGNGRVDVFNSFVIPRMRCTYIHNGIVNVEYIIKNTKMGLLVTDIGAAHVDTQSGEFVFLIEKGVLIENGRKSYIVENLLFHNNVLDVLNNINLIGNDLLFYGATCGKRDQYVPVIYGQPTISIRRGLKI